MTEDKTLGVLICEALGLPANRVQDIELLIPPLGHPLKLTVDVFVLENEFRSIDWQGKLRGADVTLTVNKYVVCPECAKKE